MTQTLTDKYRVIENPLWGFFIQRKVLIKKLFKKEFTEWNAVTENGDLTNLGAFGQLHCPLKTLKEAKEKIKDFKKDIIIHEIDDLGKYPPDSICSKKLKKEKT